MGDTLVVPISMVPTPQVLSNGSSSGPSADGESGFRASAYNERMARARNATIAQRKSGGACIATLALSSGRLPRKRVPGPEARSPAAAADPASVRSARVRSWHDDAGEQRPAVAAEHGLALGRSWAAD